MISSPTPISSPAPSAALSATSPAGIAFFDLDRTLLGCNSGFRWLLEEVHSRNMGLFAALRALGWLARYGLGEVDLEPVLLRTIATIAGRDARETATRTAEWYERVLRWRVRPGGLMAIRNHRAQGERCVLLTSATQHLSELVARDLALDSVLCTHLEIDATGLYTGRVEGRLCFGPGKVAAAVAYAAVTGVPLSACTFYTDSTSDLPMLEAVGRPVAVNPDVRLMRIARKRGWPIVDWGKANGSQRAFQR